MGCKLERWHGCLVSKFVDNNDGNPDFGLQQGYDGHVRPPGNPTSTWTSPDDDFMDTTTRAQVGALVQQAVGVSPQQQGSPTNNRFQRIVTNAGPVGFDHEGLNYQSTSTYTVITTADGLVVTAFPGLP